MNKIIGAIITLALAFVPAQMAVAAGGTINTSPQISQASEFSPLPYMI